MKYYVDVTLLSGVDVGLYFLWSKVFGQIHLGLAAMIEANGKGPVGISFPGYDGAGHVLGEKLRLLAPERGDLESLEIARRLGCLADYVHVTGVREVPDKLDGYARYKRQQPKSSNSRMARRKAKREGIAYEDALLLLSGREEERVDTPYINLLSKSSDRQFKLFIVREIADECIMDGFSSYGLSGVSTVPQF